MHISKEDFQSPNEIIDEEKFNEIYKLARLRKGMFRSIIVNSENHIDEIARLTKEDDLE